MSIIALVIEHNGPSIAVSLQQLLPNIVKEGTPLALMGIGVGLVLSTGGVDISTAGVATMAGVVFAAFTQLGWHPILAAVPAMLIGLFSGVALGVAVNRRAPPLIMSWAFGALWLTAAIVFAESGAEFGWLVGTTSRVNLGTPPSREFWGLFGGGPGICMALLFLTVSLIGLSNLPRRARAVGADADSAVYAGIRPKTVLVQSYAISGVLAAIAGVLWALVNAGGQTTDHSGRELIAVSIAVLGGTAMSGGYLSLPSVASAGLFWVSSLTLLKGMDYMILGNQQQRAPFALFALLLIATTLLLGDRLGGATRTIHADYKIKES